MCNRDSFNGMCVANVRDSRTDDFVCKLKRMKQKLRKIRTTKARFVRISYNYCINLNCTNSVFAATADIRMA